MLAADFAAGAEQIDLKAEVGDFAAAPSSLDTARVIVQLAEKSAEAQFLSSVGSLATNVRQFDKLPVVVLNVVDSEIDTLTQHPHVVSVERDIAQPPSLASSVPVINGDDVITDYGFDGTGATVVILDTGIDGDHPFFGSGGSRIIAERCFSNAGGTGGQVSLCPNGQATDTNAEAQIAACVDGGSSICDHGTHVAGIAAGSAATDPNANNDNGVASGASIIAMQVFTRFNDPGDCGTSPAPCVLSFRSDQIAALDAIATLADNNPGWGIVAANMSLGGGQHSTHCDTESMKAAIDTLLDKGIATVISAGNDSYDAAVGNPACISSALSVGSTTDADALSSFTNRGRLVDVFAPGSSIRSSVNGGGYATFQGTSMAAPHVAGALAVLRQAHPDRPISDLMTMLKETGTDITYTSGGQSVTTPRVDLLAAYNNQIEVSTTVDESDADFSHGDLSLREALEIAAMSSAASTITFESGLFSTPQTITLNGTQLEIASSVDIVGPGADLLTVDANGASRVFDIDDGNPSERSTVTLSGITVTGGSSTRGGGIVNREITTIRDSVITGNSASDGGGGIENITSYLSVLNSTIFNNQANRGGGLRSISTVGVGSTRIEQSTLSGNSATINGGAVNNYQTDVTIAFSTITNNTATAGAGVDSLYGGSATNTDFVSTIVSANPGGDVAGAANTNSLGHNIVGDGPAASQFSAPGDQTGVTDPMLGPLGTNGGATPTHAVLLGSPAIDAGAGALLITPTRAHSNVTDVHPVANLVNGNGLVYPLTTDNYSSSQHADAADTTTWVTQDVGTDYFEDGGAVPQLTFYLPEMTKLTDIVVWGYALSGAPIGHEAKTLEVSFSTDGGLTFNNEMTLDRQLTGANSETLSLGVPRLADAVRIRITDNHYQMGQPGGARVGLGEVRFLGDVYDQRGAPFRRLSSTADVGAIDNAHIVDNSGDVDDGDYSGGELTLREAIDLSNTYGGATINFDPSVSHIDLGAQLVIRDDVQIIGPGSGALVIDGNNVDRHFLIDDGNAGSTIDVEISGMQLTGGGGNTRGASIFNRERLTVSDVNFTNNHATNNGGAINSVDAGNELHVSDSTFESNTAGAGGGAIYVDGVASIANSTITSNEATGNGGGIRNEGTLSITGSTLSGNTANHGGGVYNTSQLTVTNTTVSGNSAVVNAGGIRTNSTSTLDVYHSTFADNLASNPSTAEVMTSGTSRFENSIFEGAVFGTITNAFYNVFGENESFTNGAGNLESTDPMLGPLQNNGGATLTHALLEGSPAINAGDPAATPPSFDQRGSGFDRVVGGVVDAGAVEANPPVVRSLGSVPFGASTQPAYQLGEGEVVFYRFETASDVLAADGLKFVIDTLGSTLTDGGAGPNDTEIGLYDASGNRIANNDDFGSGRESRLAFGDDLNSEGDLPAGTYYLALSAWNTTFGSTNFDASSVSTASGDLVVNFDLSNTALACDFNGDDACNGTDIDMLQAEVVAGTDDPLFDLNGDLAVTIADRDQWLALAGAENLASGNPYLLGDANLDGVVDGQDFIRWNNNKFSATSAWTDGDFNSDGIVDGQDFILWNNNKFQSADAPAFRRTLPSVFHFGDDTEESDRHALVVDHLFALG